MARTIRSPVGQSITESILMMPIYFLIIFALLQVGQLGAALVVTNYGASTVARKISQDEDPSVLGPIRGTLGPLDSAPENYKQKFENLFVAGMQYAGLTGKIDGNSNDPAATLTVNACAKVNAFPLVGIFVHSIFGNRFDARGTCDVDTGPPSFGPFQFTPSAPYAFVIRAKAQVRLNYQPTH